VVDTPKTEESVAPLPLIDQVRVPLELWRAKCAMGAGLLLQSFFGLDGDTPRPLPADALRSQRTGLTSGLRKKELAPSTVSDAAIIARGLARRAAHFHLI
jgi:hypothetical protein